MVDIAHDLLSDLERADRGARPGTRAEDRYVAAVMRRNGMSRADIAATLGIDEREIGSDGQIIPDATRRLGVPG
jgi:hypothetical protein